ncbi:MAG: zinc ribbon domain-containing protein [Patescibacteria group bacterium]|jgi:uncharacterized OB-fold protein
MTSIAENWRTRGQRLRLEGSNCPKCKIVHFPPRIICPDCGFDSQKAAKPEVMKIRTGEAEDKVG